MANKRGTGSKRPKDYVSKAYHIKVAVGLDGTFKYTADGINDASTLRPNNTDTITWSATLAGIPVPFQVEFPGFSPFAQGIRVVRSALFQTQPLTVSLPSYYHGNEVFKYTVTIANGWSDDPVVQPVPSDGLISVLAASFLNLSVQNGALTLDHLNVQYPAGEVTWQWVQGSLPDDFTVTFTNPPAGWPAQATSQNYILALYLPASGGAITYTIQTLHLGLSLANASLQTN